MTALELIIYILVTLAVLAAVGFWMFLEMQFKHRVRIKELVKGRKIIRDFRAKSYVDKDNVSWWRLAGEKDKTKKLIPLPPEESIEINQKGRKVVECYRTEFGEVIYLKETGDVKSLGELEQKLKDIPEWIQKIDDPKIKKEQLSLWKEKERLSWHNDPQIIAPYQSINTKQRMIYFNNIRKAEERRNKTDWKQQLVPIVSLGAMVILVVAGMIFWGDLAKPTIEANKQMIEMRKTDAEILNIQREILTGLQKIESTEKQGQAPVPN